MKAARSGNLEILKWARDNGCPWDKRVSQAAADTGQEGVLTWLCKISEKDPDLAHQIGISDEETFVCAAKSGSIPSLKILCTIMYDGNWHSYMVPKMMKAAFQKGNLPMIKFICAGSDRYWLRVAHELLEIAKSKNYQDVVVWLEAERVK